MDPVLTQDGPYLIQIDVDPDQPFEPRLKSRMLAGGSFATPELDDMFPFLPAEELPDGNGKPGCMPFNPRAMPELPVEGMGSFRKMAFFSAAGGPSPSVLGPAASPPILSIPLPRRVAVPGSPSRLC